MRNSYLSEALGFQPDQCVTENPVIHMSDLERKYRKLSKKCKNGKITNKKYKKNLKKIKKELRQTQALIAYARVPYKESKAASPEKTWWQEALVQSAPKLIDLAIASANHRGRK